MALALRAESIAAGAALLELFAVMFLVFGATLIATAIQLFRHRDQDPQVEDNVIVRLARRALPISDRYDDGRIITRREGQRLMTRLFASALQFSEQEGAASPAVSDLLQHQRGTRWGGLEMRGAVRSRRDAGRDHGAAVGAAAYSSSVT